MVRVLRENQTESVRSGFACVTLAPALYREGKFRLRYNPQNPLRGPLIIRYFSFRQLAYPYFIRAAHGQMLFLETPLKHCTA